MTAGGRANRESWGLSVGRAPSPAAAFAVAVDSGIFRFVAGVHDRRHMVKPKSKSKAAGEGARPTHPPINFLHHSRDSYNLNT